MIKNIIIGILVVLCVVLFFYGLNQHTAAQEFQGMAVQNAKMSTKLAEEARNQRIMAEANAREMHRQLLIAEQNLLECAQKARKKK